MKKITFGTPEKFVPSYFCDNFNYRETSITYPVDLIKFKLNVRGCRLELPIRKGEKFFGLGLQLQGFNLNGRHLVTRVNSDPISFTGDSHAPVPFFVSTAGYGIYVDTARYAEFDFGRSKPSNVVSIAPENKISTSTEEIYAVRDIDESSVVTIQIPSAKGVDIYVIEGSNITDVVSQYNMLSGGGCEVPEWGLGTLYRCCSKYSQEQVEATADYFREKNIPCSILGLEPGWQTHSYSCTYEWNKELYPDPCGMVERLTEKGFHINLWEHAFTHPNSPIYDELKKSEKYGDYEVWGGLVPDFSYDATKEIFAKHHKENVLFDKIDGFKLDECDSSDFTRGWSFPLSTEFPSGMDGEQYHSLFGVLYMKAMLKALDGKSTLSEARNAGALSSPYPFVLYSDLYAQKDFIRGLATAGFSGLLWTPELRHAESKEDLIRRMQCVVFSPQCLINAWYCEKLPWIDHDCEDEVRALLTERIKLIPKLLDAFKRYKEEGIPPVRALVSDYTDDPETYEIDDTYLFCDDMLVAPMVCGEKSRKVYLPKGNWRGYYDGKKYESGWIEVEGDNIPVFVKD